MKRAAVFLIAVIVVAAGGLTAWQWKWLAAFSAPSEGGDAEYDDAAGPAQVDDRNVKALGRLEPAGGVLTIGAVVGDRIAVLHVKEGERVEQGRLLAELASRPVRLLEQQALRKQVEETLARRNAEEKAADARIRIAELNLQKAQSSQTEIAAQETQAALAESNLELAQRDFQRYERLSAALVSKQDLERQRLLVKKAEAELVAAQAALDSLRESSRFAQEAAAAEAAAAVASKEQVLSAIPVESLKKKLQIAVKQTEQTLVTAPAAGTVLRVFTREGELIANKPILQMADLTKMICVAEVFEGDLARIRVGQEALVTGHAFPEEQKQVKGKVSRIGGLIATPELRSLDPFASTDRHVVEVEIALEPGELPDAARLANLQVDVTILTSGDEGADEDSPGMAQSRP